MPGSIAASGQSILIVGAERVDGPAARLAMEVKWHSNWAIALYPISERLTRSAIPKSTRF